MKTITSLFFRHVILHKPFLRGRLTIIIGIFILLLRLVLRLEVHRQLNTIIIIIIYIDNFDSSHVGNTQNKYI